MRSKLLSILIISFMLLQAIVSTTDSNAEAADTNVLQSFGSRTSAGYYNYSETVQIFSDIEKNYPSIAKIYDLSARYPHLNNTPKKTRFNNSIWAMRISDNPSVDEKEEPAVLYVSLHHAREWISVQVSIYMASYLTKNYNSNATVKDMVNNNEIWILPVLNPDGYIYSHEMDDINRSSGSGGWRKNRVETNGVPGFQDGGGGSGDGVDFNRNYGYKWGYDNIGSDPSNTSSTYRGPSPFSEVETQIMRDFALEMEFATAVSFHSHSEIIILPYAYDDLDTPHHKIFMEMGEEMGKHNGYPHGNSKSGLIYNANGEWGDWMYNALECYAFTFEIGTVFIHPANTIQPFCRKNAEAAFIAARYAGNPFALFESGLQGSVKDTKGNPIEGAMVSTSFINFSLSATTDSDGKYLINLPDGPYEVSVQKDGYEEKVDLNANVPSNGKGTLDIVLRDIVPPVITDVKAAHVLGGGESETVFNATDEVVIIVRDNASETDLTGYVIINSTSQDYISEPLELSFSLVLEYYYVYWQTDELNQSDDYRVDAVLTDYDGNSDLLGANDLGPDLTLTLLDITPPIISSVRSRVSSDIGGMYETGSTVRIEVYEEFHEEGLSGTVQIFDPVSGFSTGVKNLVYESELYYYYWDWDTSEVLPSTNYYVESTLSDKWGNTDPDGRPDYPDIQLTLHDTTAPVISSMSSFVGGDADNIYEQDSIVTFQVCESKNESRLNGYVSVQSPDLKGQEPLILSLSFDPSNNYYTASWDTAEAVPYIDYYIDSVLEDNYQNGDYDGAVNFGPDIVLIITDTKAPVIDDIIAVNDYTQMPSNNKFEIGEVVRIIVAPEVQEPGLAGRVAITSTGSDFQSEDLEIKFDIVKDHYYAIWHTKGLPIGSNYNVDANLSDPHGNIDLDGLKPNKPDLILSLVDTTPPRVTGISVSYPTQLHMDLERIEIGFWVRIDVSIFENELLLSGRIEIVSSSTDYESGSISTVFNESTKSYVAFWNTTGLRPGEDYALEALFTDPHSNLDKDGLREGPDMTLILEDTMPPKAVRDLLLAEDADREGIVNLLWDEPEENSTVEIYRSETEINSKNDAELINRISTGAPGYTDAVGANGKTYYYLVLIIDENGNLNETIYTGNTGSVTVSKSEPSSGPGAMMFAAIAVVVIVLLIMAVLFYLRKRKGLVQTKQTDGIELTEDTSPEPPEEQRTAEDIYKDDYL